MRWRYKIPLAFLLLLAALPVLLVVAVTQTGVLRELFTSRINALIPRQIPLKLAVEKISGPYYKGVVFHGLAVVNKTRSADTVLSAQEISLSYNWRDLWRRQWVVRRMDIRGLRIRLPADSLLKGWVQSLEPQGTGKKAAPPSLAVDTLSIIDAGLEAVGRERFRIADLHLAGAMRLAAGQLTAKVEKAEFVLPDFYPGPVRVHLAGNAVPGKWAVDSLAILSPQSRVFLSGAGGKTGQLHVVTDSVALEELSLALGISLHGQARFDGTIAFDSTFSIEGEGLLSGEIENRTIDSLQVSFHYADERVDFSRLEGTALKARFAGDGFLDFSTAPETFGYEGTVRDFNLNRVAFETFETDLGGWVSLHGESLSEKHLRLDLDVNLRGNRFGEYTFDSAAGNIRVTTTQVDFSDGFYVSYRNTSAYLSGSVNYTDSLDLFGNVYFNDLRDFEGQTFIDSLDGRGYAFCSLVGRTASPDLIGQFESDSLRMFDLSTGRFSSRYFIPHVFDQRGGWAQLSWGKSTAWSLPIDSLRARLRFSGTEVAIDSARASLPDIALQSNGWLDWERDTVPVKLYDFAGVFEGHSFYAADTVRFTMDTAGFMFAPFVIDGEPGRVQAEGAVDFETRLDGRVTVERFQFDPYWRRLFPQVPLAGNIEFTAKLGGDFDHPTIEASGSARDLVYDGRYIGDLSGACSYAGQRLAVDTFTLNHPQWSLTGGGKFPVDLTFGEVKNRVLDSPMDFRVTGTGQALDPFVWLLPDVVESVRGPWNLAVRLTGTPTHPRLDGMGRLTGATVKAVELENPLENLDVRLELRNDTIRVISASGTTKSGRDHGDLSADGAIKVEALDSYRYDLQIGGTGIPAQFEFQDYTVTADLDLAVTGSIPPLVSGTIRVLSAEDREQFTFEEEYELPDTTLWDWDIAVTCPGNYRIRNDQVDAELACDLRLLRERGVVSILGTAELVPGRSKVYVFDRVGRIERGLLTFDQPGKSDPALDLEISFRIPRAAPTSGNGSAVPGTEYARDIDLALLVGGRASEPLIRTAEGSPYSDQDILLLLAANRPTTMDTLASERDVYLNRIKFAATGLLASELERLMTRAVGLETLSLKPGATTAETELTVGTYFLRNFYVYGSSMVAFDRGQEVGFEYRFGRGLYLDGRRDKNNLYRLNLHLNWEY